MIERPDWNAPTTTAPAVTPSAVAEGDESRDLTVAGPSAALVDVGPSSTDIDAVTGLPGDVIRDLTNTAEGFGPQLSMLQESATRVLSEVKDSAAFAAHFDTLSPPVQTKVYRTLMRNPGIRLQDLADKVEPLFTLAEAAEANAWIEKWNARCRSPSA